MVVLLKSVSGKIPAGSVQLDLTKPTSIPIKTTSKIDKCPDKNATIELTFEVESMGEVEGYEEEIEKDFGRANLFRQL